MGDKRERERDCPPVDAIEGYPLAGRRRNGHGNERDVRVRRLLGAVDVGHGEGRRRRPRVGRHNSRATGAAVVQKEQVLAILLVLEQVPIGQWERGNHRAHGRHFTLYSAHWALCTVHCALCTRQRTPRTGLSSRASAAPSPSPSQSSSSSPSPSLPAPLPTLNF